MLQEQVPCVEGELSLREVQLASLAILKRIDAICRAEGIRYWVMYGTLIGAIRHHGFIPWDDDLDIAMPRPDYERFLAYFAEHSDELRPLVALRGDGSPTLPFLITRVSDTTYRMVGEYGDEVPDLGAFVDVYPMDGAGDTLEGARKHKVECMKASHKYLQAGDFSYNNRENGALKRTFKKIHSTMLGDASKWANRVVEMSKKLSFDESTFVACLEWDWALEEIYPSKLFSKVDDVTFEDMKVSVPVGYDEILTADYGDYMQLPPEPERVGHHFYAIVRR